MYLLSLDISILFLKSIEFDEQFNGMPIFPEDKFLPNTKVFYSRDIYRNIENFNFVSQEPIDAIYKMIRRFSELCPKSHFTADISDFNPEPTQIPGLKHIHIIFMVSTNHHQPPISERLFELIKS